MQLDISNINDKIIGNNKAIETFVKALNKSTDSSSWIVEGPKGIGKASLLKYISSNLLKITYDINDSKNFYHPDLVLLEKSEEKKNIAVDEVRKLKKLFFKTSYSETYRVAIIDSINELNLFGHNAILKIIEEPPADSFIFIVDHQSDKVPATIKSRCKIFRFNKLNDNDVSSILMKKYNSIKESEIRFYSMIANGSIGDAVYFFNNNAMFLYKKICSFLFNIEKFTDNDANNLINIISKNKNELSIIFFKLLDSLINNIIKKKVLKKIIFSKKEEESLIEYLVNIFSLEKLFYIKEVLNNNYMNYTNLNTDLHSTIYSLLITISNNTNKEIYEK